jgi:hypothetical protein
LGSRNLQVAFVVGFHSEAYAQAEAFGYLPFLLACCFSSFQYSTIPLFQFYSASSF